METLMSTLTSKTKLIDLICQVDRFWKLVIPSGGEEEEQKKMELLSKRYYEALCFTSKRN